MSQPAMGEPDDEAKPFCISKKEFGKRNKTGQSK